MGVDKDEDEVHVVIPPTCNHHSYFLRSLHVSQNHLNEHTLIDFHHCTLNDFISSSAINRVDIQIKIKELEAQKLEGEMLYSYSCRFLFSNLS